MKEKDILCEYGKYWVLSEKDKYTVVEMKLTHGISDSSYPKTEDGLTLAIARCKYLFCNQSKFEVIEKNGDFEDYLNAEYSRLLAKD